MAVSQYANVKTPAQIANEKKYLSNLASTGDSGTKAWATSQMKDLDTHISSLPTTSSSTVTSTASTLPKSSTSIMEKMVPTSTKNYISAKSSGKTLSDYYNDKLSSMSTTQPTAQQPVPYAQQVPTTIPYEQPYDQNTLTDYYKNALKENLASNEKAKLAAIQQGVQNINAQRSNIDISAQDAMRNAYIQRVQGEKALPVQMAAQGLTGGAAETSMLTNRANYGNQLNTIDVEKRRANQDISNKIAELQASGNLSIAEGANDITQNYSDKIAQALALQEENQRTATKEDRQSAIDNLSQYAGDYQARINELMATDPTNWAIPYLRNLREAKIAKTTADTAKSTQQSYENALAKWQATGTIDDEATALTLGLPVGSKTMDYQNMIVDNALALQKENTSNSKIYSDTKNENSYNTIFTNALKLSTGDYKPKSIIAWVNNQALTTSDKQRMIIELGLLDAVEGTTPTTENKFPGLSKIFQILGR